MTYKEELFNTLEQFLLDNNIYSQFTTHILERFHVSLLEFCNRYYKDSGGLDYLFYDYWDDLDIYEKWFHIAIDLKYKYERGV